MRPRRRWSSLAVAPASTYGSGGPDTALFLGNRTPQFNTIRRRRSGKKRKAAARVALWGRVFQRLLYALYRQRIVLLLVLVIVASAGTYYVWLNQTNLPTVAAAAG